ncbi:hypothetical protein [Bradyrhizobium arachidis]|nr:hypothetical protein [Bradyrhizobium arachidis]
MQAARTDPGRSPQLERRHEDAVRSAAQQALEIGFAHFERQRPHIVAVER